MKKIFTILAAVLLTASVFAQLPEKMSYQAVVRDVSDNLVPNQEIGMQISILQGSETGTAVYVETQTPTTNANGLITIEIGGQNATVITGSFSTIDWVAGTYFIKTETDPAGGINYTITGTSQLLSVPYALHAKTAESITGRITETDPVFGIAVTGGITTTDTDNWNNKLEVEVDGDITNEIQDLQLVGNILTITNNGTATDIDLSAYLDNTDTQLTETEVDNYVSNNGYSTTDTTLNEAEVDAFVANNGYLTAEVDGDITNEIQDLQLVGNILTITNNGTATDIDLSSYLDNTDTQLTETEVDNYVSNNGYSTTDTTLNEAEVDAFVSNNGYLTAEVDGSVTNEIQTISRAGLTVTLSNGGGTFQDSINTYTAGTGIDITNNVISTGSFYLGQDTLGGIVYYIYTGSDGEQHGLIVSKTETTAKWQNTGVTTNATRSWDGVYNMNLMTDSPAKTYVESLGAGWYLPSVDELSILWHNRFHANKALNDGGHTLLSNTTYYWSSTEYNAGSAFGFYFANGYSTNNGKTTTYSVRSVRAF